MKSPLYILQLGETFAWFGQQRVPVESFSSESTIENNYHYTSDYLKPNGKPSTEFKPKLPVQIVAVVIVVLQGLIFPCYFLVAAADLLPAHTVTLQGTRGKVHVDAGLCGIRQVHLVANVAGQLCETRSKHHIYKDS